MENNYDDPAVIRALQNILPPIQLVWRRTTAGDISCYGAYVTAEAAAEAIIVALEADRGAGGDWRMAPVVIQGITPDILAAAARGFARALETGTEDARREIAQLKQTH